MVGGVAVLCYINILRNDFCYDDVAIVRDNPKVQGGQSWSDIWTTDYWSHTGQDRATRDLLFRPVTLSLLRLTRIVAGPSPLAFHVISLLLHGLCALLVLILARKLFESSREPVEASNTGFCWIPLSAGLLFAVLPIHSEAVASVVGQADLIATAAMIGALLSHLRTVHSHVAGKKLLWGCTAAAMAFAAMGAKESGICVVPIIFLLEWLNPANRGRPEARLISRIGRAAYLLLPLAAYLLLRHHALGGQLHQAPAPTRTVNVLVDAPAWQHGLGVMQAWGMYLAKMVFPRVLAIEYAINSVRLATSLWQFHVLLGILWSIALAVIALKGWKSQQKALTFLVLALLVSYFPTSNALVLIQVYFAERIWYLPSVFAVCLFAWAARGLWRRRLWRSVGAVLLIAMAARCLVRNSEWRNNGTLFAAAYYDHPASVLSRHLYGQWLTQNGQIDEGINLLRKSLEIDLGFTDAQRSLGLAYLIANQPEPALRHLQIAEMQAPGHAPTQAALAQAAAKLEEQRGQGLAKLKSAAQQNPTDLEKNLTYIRELRELGQTSEALALLEMPESPFAMSAEWIGERAITLVLSDRRDEAIASYRRALSLEPDHAQRCVELAMLLLERRATGDIDEASGLAARARKLNPQSSQVYLAIGEVEILKGNRAAAREAFDEALRHADPYGDFARMIRERRQSLGL